MSAGSGQEEQNKAHLPNTLHHNNKTNKGGMKGLKAGLSMANIALEGLALPPSPVLA